MLLKTKTIHRKEKINHLHNARVVSRSCLLYEFARLYQFKLESLPWTKRGFWQLHRKHGLNFINPSKPKPIAKETPQLT